MRQISLQKPLKYGQIQLNFRIFLLRLFSAWRHSCAQSFWSSCKLSNFAFFLTWAPYLPALVPERRDADDLVPVEGIARVRPDAEEGASAVSLAGILTFKYIITGESWIEPAKPNVATTKLGGLVGTRFGDYLCLDCCVFKWMPSIYVTSTNTKLARRISNILMSGPHLLHRRTDGLPRSPRTFSGTRRGPRCLTPRNAMFHSGVLEKND